MKKIIFAAATAVAMFAFSGTAEARRLSQNTQYSAQVEDMSSFDPIGEILGGSNWKVIPAIQYHVQKFTYHGTNKHYARYSHGHGSVVSHSYSGPISASIVTYGHMLQNMGYRVSEHPAFGGVHHVHHGWAHYAGRAIDVNVGRGVYEAHSAYAGRFDRLAAAARHAGYTVLWRVAGHFDHMHIQR